jgi:D-alanine-D-alanine ligase-like ATP-grasp enzyme
MSLAAVRQRINRLNRKHCFEIFGYDYMIDAQQHPWLIEVNTNPDITLSSKLL